jgi:hypothetical protein
VSQPLIEPSSTIECFRPPPPIKKRMQIFKSAHGHIRAWGAHGISHFYNFIIFQLRSSTEQMHALVHFAMLNLWTTLPTPRINLSPERRT